ncbi:hypothetical protein HNQ79_006441 [Streptomyces candidus]|uniref:Uncharacterized protein n=1 Tax=Streptomyces candidus TaxID=67283 RepID=A0A7X0HLM3_9ACTN|nr:hypothetical protein [Streptomyces candidus]
MASMGQSIAVGFLHLCTIGISYAVKHGTMRHCPQCKHLLGGHARRNDGSFQD